MTSLLRSVMLLSSLLPLLASAADVNVLVAGAANAGVEALLPGFWAVGSGQSSRRAAFNQPRPSPRQGRQERAYVVKLSVCKRATKIRLVDNEEPIRGLPAKP